MSFSMALGAWFSVEDLNPMLSQRVARFLVDIIAQNDGHSQINVDRYKAPRTNDQRPSKWRGFSTTLPTVHPFHVNTKFPYGFKKETTKLCMYASRNHSIYIAEVEVFDCAYLEQANSIEWFLLFALAVGWGFGKGKGGRTCTK